MVGFRGARLTVLELGTDGAYAEEASLGTAGTVEVSRPFPVRVSASALVP
jgi:hypothetical protein